MITHRDVRSLFVVLFTVLLLINCGAREVEIAEQWKPGRRADCSMPTLRLLVYARHKATVEAAGKRAEVQKRQRDARPIPAAAIEWKSSELPTDGVLDIRITDGRHVQHIRHKLTRPPQEIEFPHSGGIPLVSPVSADVRVSVAGEQHNVTNASVVLDDDILRFQFRVCHATRAASPVGSVQIQQDVLTYRIPGKGGLGTAFSNRSEYDEIPFSLKLQSVDKIEEEIFLVVKGDSLARLLFANVSQRPNPSDQPHRHGGALLVFQGDPTSPSSKLTLLNAEQAELNQVSAVAIRQDHQVVMDSCRYTGYSGTVERIRTDSKVTVYETRSSRVIGTHEFQGPSPPSCEQKVWVWSGTRILPYVGKPPDEEVKKWLQGL